MHVFLYFHTCFHIHEPNTPLSAEMGENVLRLPEPEVVNLPILFELSNGESANDRQVTLQLPLPPFVMLYDNQSFSLLLSSN